MRISDWSSDVCSSDLLLPAQVQVLPLSVTRQPNPGLAITFDHGAGGACPGARCNTYSWPSALNPPRPLSNCRSSGRANCGVSGAGSHTVVGMNGGIFGSASTPGAHFTATVPRPVPSQTSPARRQDK